MRLHDRATIRVPRRVGVIGAGAMGTSLAAVLGGRVPVAIVARDDQRAAFLRRHGAEVCGLACAVARPVVVSRIGELAALGALDAIFVATKTTAIDQVGDELRTVLEALGADGGTPFIVSFQNGIEPGRRLIERLQNPRVLRMVLNFGARLAPEGRAELLFSHPPHVVGCLEPAYGPVCRGLAALLTSCGMETKAVEDIEPLVWTKGLLNAAMSPVAALMNSSVGEVLDSPARMIVARLLEEGLAVAAAEGVDLGEGVRAHLWRIYEEARAHVPSMVDDLRRGRPSEVGQLNRQVIEHAERLGVETPDHRLVTALIDAFDWRVFSRNDADRPVPVTKRESASC